jgi:hypothetical protein
MREIGRIGRIIVANANASSFALHQPVCLLNFLARFYPPFAAVFLF